MNRPESMISFAGQGNYSVPLELLTEREKLLVERKGYIASWDCRNEDFCWIPYYYFPGNHKPNNLIYRSIPAEEFPSIFCSWREVPFYDTSIPIYVQMLLHCPIEPSREGWALNKEIKKTISSIKLLQQDLESFPLEPFYELIRDKLPTFNNWGYDKQVDCGAYADFEQSRIMFGSKSKKNLFDFDWFALTFFHEAYHFMEFDLGDKIAELLPENSMLDNSRSYTPCGGLLRPMALSEDVRWGLKWEKIENGGRVLNIYWTDGNIETHMEHLAEILAALTFIKHPEAKERVRQQHQSICEMAGLKGEFPKEQLHLFDGWYPDRLQLYR